MIPVSRQLSNRAGRWGAILSLRRVPRQHRLHPCAVDIVAAQDHCRRPATAPLTFLYERRERRRSSTLGTVMRGAVNDPNRFRDLVVRDLHDFDPRRAE